ncbi:ribonuclease HII [Lederbergia wuyishanensis]|uniref:Ribonuclease HII n=1 Tax=Lederbergia wuyishanensis TaxID=1347903 RepID=A0ABU0CZQ1_9BACI|nr:ribonuclease HII [Lederbergia wuyishanensis]MCJ8006247.1 ribonuclease HII [Lederbergia wuyishanensis]MDQ0341616.1 ribonuclease HII [Lederbergia wuyishanensis]
MKKTSIQEIKKIIDQIQDENNPFLKQLTLDSRKGVKDLLEKWHHTKKQERDQRKQYIIMETYERRLRKDGFKLIAGLDEVGRGPLAGPVVSAAVILEENSYIPGLNDSKKLTEKKREELYSEIMSKSVAVGIGILSSEEIDRVNIYEATKKSMLAAVQNLSVQPDYLLLDAMKINSIYPEISIIKGDAKSVSIAAASIVAKVTRDGIMKDYHEQYPHYGFHLHMGYGTKLHLDALNDFGPCPIHRKTFAPIKKLFE